ncbi:hypothetical protein HK104_002666 [Borealophlyctis nickersoniae]|nr:hypothetical protein HK104_002666 [Borealophlyctis nickersoniae]
MSLAQRPSAPRPPTLKRSNAFLAEDDGGAGVKAPPPRPPPILRRSNAHGLGSFESALALPTRFLDPTPEKTATTAVVSPIDFKSAVSSPIRAQQPSGDYPISAAVLRYKLYQVAAEQANNPGMGWDEGEFVTDFADNESVASTVIVTESEDEDDVPTEVHSSRHLPFLLEPSTSHLQNVPRLQTPPPLSDSFINPTSLLPSNFFPAFQSFGGGMVTTADTAGNRPTVSSVPVPTTIAGPATVATVPAPPSLPVPAHQIDLNAIDGAVESDGVSSSSGRETSPAPSAPIHPRKKRRVAGYQCEVEGCGRTFSRQYNLKVHMETHDPNRTKEFQCQICPKSFTRAHDLKRHLDTHANRKNYACKLCSKRYTRHEGLRKHMANVHQDTVE